MSSKKPRNEYSRPLNYPQQSLLKQIDAGEVGPPSPDTGRSNTTLSWAVRRKLIRWDETATPHRWRLTDAGRKALQTHRVEPDEGDE